jgi:hypothetical protein
MRLNFLAGWLLLPTALLLPSITSAQVVQIVISPEIKLSKIKTFQEHLHTDAGGHYAFFYDETKRKGLTLQGPYQEAILEKYDREFNLVFSKTYRTDKSNIASLGMRYFNGQIFWLFSETNKREDYIRYYLQPIDLNGKKGKLIEIAKFNYENSDVLPQVSWYVSRDSSKLLFQAITDKNRPTEKFRGHLSVLNKDLNVLYSKKMNLSFPEKQVEVLTNTIKNDGSAYALVKIYDDPRARETKKAEDKGSVAAYDIVLIRYAAGADPKQIPIDVNQAYISAASLSTNRQDDLKCAGFYANTRSGTVNGVFFLDLNQDGSVRQTRVREFSPEDIQNLGNRNVEKDRRGDLGLGDDFRFSEFFIRDDGSAVVTAEENYTVTTTNFYLRSQQTTTYHYSNDIIALMIDNQGNIERVKRIPKYQIGTNTDYFLSNASILYKDDVVFFYNEDRDNLSKPVDNPRPQAVSNFDAGITVMTVLDRAGNLSRRVLLDTGKSASLFVPENCSPFDGNKLFFMSVRPRFFGDNIFQMGTISLP